jgi:hypothetical protein
VNQEADKQAVKIKAKTDIVLINRKYENISGILEKV